MAFKFECLIQNEGVNGYTDWQFTDGNPRKSYVLSRENDTGKFYAVEQTSQSDDGEFDEGIQMPDHHVAWLRGLLPTEALAA